MTVPIGQGRAAVWGETLTRSGVQLVNCLGQSEIEELRNPSSSASHWRVSGPGG